MAEERAAAGFQLGFHAIGDEANTIALNAFAAAEQVAVPARQPRPRPPGLHASSPPPPQHPLQTTSASASSTPRSYSPPTSPASTTKASSPPCNPRTCSPTWPGPAQRLGPERTPYAYAWRSMLDHHIPLAFGTDYPVESISPFRGLYSAVTRKNEAGTQTFHPEQRLTIAEAIYAYTQASAFAEFRETRLGRLEPGFLADFIVLDRDLLTASPQDILKTRSSAPSWAAAPSSPSPPNPFPPHPPRSPRPASPSPTRPPDLTTGAVEHS